MGRALVCWRGESVGVLERRERWCVGEEDSLNCLLSRRSNDSVLSETVVFVFGGRRRDEGGVGLTVECAERKTVGDMEMLQMGLHTIWKCYWREHFCGR